MAAEIERIQKQFLWRGQEAPKSHYIKWNIVSKPKKACGLALGWDLFKVVLYYENGFGDILQRVSPFRLQLSVANWASWKRLESRQCQIFLSPYSLEKNRSIAALFSPFY